MNYTIIVIDDYEDTLELLKYNLSKEGYSVQTFSDSQVAFDYICKHTAIDLVLTDWMMPRLSGLELSKRLKMNEQTRNIPIVMLTCKNEESDVVTALEIGADDYIAKPFRMKELTVRIRKVMERKNNYDLQSQVHLHKGNIHLNLSAFTAAIGEQTIELTYTEFKLLEMLASKPGKVFTRNEIIEKIAGPDHIVTHRSVDVQVVGLRKKLLDEKNRIETVRSVGYRFMV